MTAWLTENWNKLKEFIVSYYAYLKSMVNAGIINTVNWVRSRVDEIVSWATSWFDWLKNNAITLVNNLKNDVIGWWNNLWSTAQSWVNNARAWAEQLFNDARNTVYSVRDWLLARIDDARRWADQVGNNIRGVINQVSTDLQNWVKSVNQNFQDWVSSVIEGVKGIIDNVKVDFQNRIAQIKVPDVSPFQIFMQSIETTVWAIIEKSIQPWVNWWLAVLFWHGKSSPPPKPNLWNLQPGGGGYYPPPGEGGGQSFIWPTPTKRISGYRFGPNHKGVDIGINMGDPIKAVMDGVVTNAGYSDVGYGFMVRLAHSGGWGSLYGHLVTPVVQVGQNVVQGQLIGVGDSTGNSTGPHLHLEVYKGSVYYDPLTLLP